jgi:hypothetical protein
MAVFVRGGGGGGTCERNDLNGVCLAKVSAQKIRCST